MGGCPTAFRHVPPEGHEVKLFQFRKGKTGGVKELRVPIKKSSLKNAGDSFVLATETTTYVYNEEGASAFEKNAANNKAEKLESEREGKAPVVFEIDDGFWAEFKE